MANANSPAFPKPNAFSVADYGVTKIELAAFHALTGIMANPNWNLSPADTALAASNAAEALMYRLHLEEKRRKDAE